MRDSPPTLVVLSRAVFRDKIIEQACGTSIYPLVKKVNSFMRSCQQFIAQYYLANDSDYHSFLLLFHF